MNAKHLGLAAAFVMWSGAAFAQAESVPLERRAPSPPPTDPALQVTPPPAPADVAHFAITPRVQYLFSSLINEHQLVDFGAASAVGGAVSAQRTEILNFPFGGLTLEYGPGHGIPFDFLLSGFYGEGSADSQFFSINTRALAGTAGAGIGAVAPGFFQTGKLDVQRYDFELLARYRPPEQSTYFLGGVRYIQIRNKTTIDPTTVTAAFGLDPTVVTPTAVAGREVRVNDRRYVLEGGIGHSTPLTSDGRFNVFANMILGVGYANFTGDASNLNFIFPSLDLSIGASYVVTENMDVSARYRGFFIYNTAGHVDFEAVHGPEVSLTYRF